MGSAVGPLRLRPSPTGNDLRPNGERPACAGSGVPPRGTIFGRTASGRPVPAPAFPHGERSWGQTGCRGTVGAPAFPVGQRWATCARWARRTGEFVPTQGTRPAEPLISAKFQEWYLADLGCIKVRWRADGPTLSLAGTALANTRLSRPVRRNLDPCPSADIALQRMRAERRAAPTVLRPDRPRRTDGPAGATSRGSMRSRPNEPDGTRPRQRFFARIGPQTRPCPRPP